MCQRECGVQEIAGQFRAASEQSRDREEVVPSGEISARLNERRVLLNGINEYQMRAVTHYDVDRAGCTTALGALAEAVEAGPLSKPASVRSAN